MNSYSEEIWFFIFISYCTDPYSRSLLYLDISSALLDLFPLFFPISSFSLNRISIQT